MFFQLLVALLLFHGHVTLSTIALLLLLLLLTASLIAISVPPLVEPRRRLIAIPTGLNVSTSP
jgi:hypothetical protein